MGDTPFRTEMNASETFYEGAWEMRRRFMEGLIQEGETHPLRVISRYASRERYKGHGRLLNIDPETLFTQKNISNIDISPNGEFSLKLQQMPTGLGLTHAISTTENYIEIPTYYFKAPYAFFLDYLRHSDFDAIVELGSGYSKNLIELYYHGGPKIPYYAGEFTKSGTECATMLSKLAPEMNLRPFRFDYKNPDLSPVREKGKVLFFTCHSIEQVEEVPSTLLQTIANHAQQVECVHLEPFGYQFQMTEKPSQLDLDHQEMFHSKHWNKNLFEVILRSHQSGAIKLKYLGKNIMGGNVQNPTSVAVWSKP